MSTATALDFTYVYPFASTVEETSRGLGVRLATCGARHEHPHFFEGRIYEPRAVGQMLLVLGDIVRTHFFVPRPGDLDPVVTSSEKMLRFEGFSGCCGVYARIDLPSAAFDCEFQGRGTTNVDFNPPMRAALNRLRDDARVDLKVGVDEVALHQGGESVVEKKVKLPMRWIKGFSEVQAYQPGLVPKLQVSATEARRFVRGLPRSGAARRIAYVVSAGKSLRLTSRKARGAISISGADRLRVLEPLLSVARTMRIWSDEGSGVSAWELDFGAGRFFMMLSPELYRGFSGEGQVLAKLAGDRWQQALELVQAELAWQSDIDSDALATRIGRATDEVEAALAVLGSRGLAGYDAASKHYFHRALPFDLVKVEALQPRLKGARKLLDERRVEIVDRAGEDAFDLAVGGTDVDHHVRLRPDGDRCTCPWFNKHQGQRGPCKHVLAARMFVERADEPGATE